MGRLGDALWAASPPEYLPNAQMQMRGLGCTTVDAVGPEGLEAGVEAGEIRREDASVILAYVASHPGSLILRGQLTGGGLDPDLVERIVPGALWVEVES